MNISEHIHNFKQEMLRGTLVKCTVNGGCIGWWLGKNFLSKSKVNENFEIIKNEKLSF